MYVRKVKRKCLVRGCRNTDSFAISQTREVGNTVIICKSCLSSALESLDDINPKTKSNIPAAGNGEIPPLFFNAEATAGTFGAAEVEKQPEVTACTCPACGREFKSEKALNTHIRHCVRQENNE